MAGIFRKIEKKMQVEKIGGGKLHKEEIVRLEEKGGRHHKEEVVHVEEDLFGNEANEYLKHFNDNEQHESGMIKKIKQKKYKKKEKIGKKGARDYDSSSSSDSD